jgi:hypothetical protein
VGDLEKILLTSAFTAIGATAVFVLGQIVQRVVIEPVIELRKTIGEVEAALVMYAGMVTSPATRNDDGTIERVDSRREAERTFRELASKHSASAYTVTWGYSLAHRWRLVPSRANIGSARRSLIGLSNSAFPRDPMIGVQYTDDARGALGLPSHD